MGSLQDWQMQYPPFYLEAGSVDQDNKHRAIFIELNLITPQTKLLPKSSQFSASADDLSETSL